MWKNRIGVFIISTSVALCCQQSGTAQTVQLPSISSFSYSGSVLVPDRGSTSLGGVSRSAMGRSSRGLGNRAFGAGLGHSGARAHVTIIDNDAIDRQIRGLPPRGSGVVRRARSVARPAQGDVRTAQGNARSGKISRPSIADPDVEGKALVRFARRQYLAGKKSSSFEAYGLAIQTLSPELSELAEAEFHRVFPTNRPPVNVQPNRLANTRPVTEIAR
jgi:hypothetical protein